MKKAENLRMKMVLGSGKCLKKIRRSGGWRMMGGQGRLPEQVTSKPKLKC